MNTTFFFYDLETSGLNPRSSRIMQFAGQRTDLEMNKVGDPVNTLIKLTADILPDPRAVLVTGITPQQTLESGSSEAEFLKMFHKSISVPGTIFVGYNSVRFDDEFMRFLNYRNYYDPYQWEWQDGRSRWDLLDVIRMTRALRPEGIVWPNDNEGKTSNRLELLTKANHIPHKEAHDALADVLATIEVARLLLDKQPKLFSYLLKLRQKSAVSELVLSGRPFIYTSGKYSSDYQKTTIAKLITEHPRGQGALVYDLRYDPAQFMNMSVEELIKSWKYDPLSDEPRLPVKTLQFNRCPAVAPISVLDEASAKRIAIDLTEAKKNEITLKTEGDFKNNLLKALEKMDKDQDKRYQKKNYDVDQMLYDGFFEPSDQKLMTKVHDTTPSQLKDMQPEFKDKRLNSLWPLYKARNFQEILTDSEKKTWDEFRVAKLKGDNTFSPLTNFNSEVEELSAKRNLSKRDQQLIAELKDYLEKIIS